MANSAKTAINLARRESRNRSRDWTGYCLMFVRTAFGVNAVHPSAITAWNAAKKKHTDGDIPRGVPVFWKGGKHGHVALSLGGGRCISTDVKRRGYPDVVTIASIGKAWGFELLGWTEDINGVTVYSPPEKRTPNITEALEARVVEKRIAALKEVQKKGNKRAQAAATKWLAALNEQGKANKQIASARATLEKMEVT